MSEIFDRGCRLCPRLATFLDSVASEQPGYYCRPVPPFGASDARLLIVGLAPGMHGANRTGRPFTGDYAGVLLYQTLYKFGFASQPDSVAADDPLELLDCRITNAVKCLPPGNKPLGAEVNTCNRYLKAELGTMPPGSVVLALGGIAHRAIVKAMAGRQAEFRFGHAGEHAIDGRFTLLDSYHCSRYNTNTRRLTTDMFEAVFRRVRGLLPIAD